MTTVINVKDAPADWQADDRYVYIGRQMPRRGLKRSPFANPFKLDDCERDRQLCVAKYRQWLIAQPELVRRVKLELTGKVLVCWCKPELCHGDVLVAICDKEE